MWEILTLTLDVFHKKCFECKSMSKGFCWMFHTFFIPKWPLSWHLCRNRQLEGISVVAQQFHETLEPLNEWLTTIEKRLANCEPIGTQASKLEEQIAQHKVRYPLHMSKIPFSISFVVLCHKFELYTVALCMIAAAHFSCHSFVLFMFSFLFAHPFCFSFFFKLYFRP